MVSWTFGDLLFIPWPTKDKPLVSRRPADTLDKTNPTQTKQCRVGKFRARFTSDRAKGSMGKGDDRSKDKPVHRLLLTGYPAVQHVVDSLCTSLLALTSEAKTWNRFLSRRTRFRVALSRHRLSIQIINLRPCLDHEHAFVQRVLSLLSLHSLPLRQVFPL